MVPCWLVWHLYKPKSETKPIQNMSCHSKQDNKQASVRNLQNDERLHVPDTGVPTQTRANLRPVRNTEIICAKRSMCFFKKKERENCTNLQRINSYISIQWSRHNFGILSPFPYFQLMRIHTTFVAVPM